MDTMACMKVSERGEIDLAFILGGNLYNANPIAARDEEHQKTTQESMFNFVRMSDGGIVRL